jgi:ribonucleoside-diphosphate reductase alpha chain
MMAALTPMVSGSISKTVNLPNNVSIEDFETVVLDSWKMGVKAVALYRDGCKMSQPLTSAFETSGDKVFEDMNYSELVNVANNYKNMISRMPLRERPAGIRPAKEHEAVIDGLKLLITTAFYNDGRLAEVYIQCDKQGSMIKGLLDSLSKLISKMIQYNIPINDIIRSLKGQKYEPSGFVTGHPYIMMADSISDLVSKILAIEVGDFSGCQVKPVGADIPVFNVSPIVNIKRDNNVDEKAERVYGKICPSCGSAHMQKNGTCFVCSDCGSTTGCS